jgi:hypothetical protein
MKRLIALALFIAGQACAATATFVPDTTTIFANPNRGFHFQSGELGNLASLDLSDIVNGSNGARLATPIESATLNNVVTQLGSDVPSEATLATYGATLAAARSKGVMLGLRFMSTGNAAQMVAQAAALKPLLAGYADVIAYVQAGFRCNWGEWAENCKDNNNAADKTAVQQAVLAMVPPDVPVEFTQVYPMQEHWYGKAPLGAADAFSGSSHSRSGFHSDCFLTGQGDSSFFAGPGTYGGYKSTTTEQQKRAYVAAASEFVSFGGETCNTSQGAIAPGIGQMRTACSGVLDSAGNPGGILVEGPRYHVSHLNISYAPNFLAAWAAGGCLPTVNRLMGYRFQLDSLSHPDSAARGSEVTFTVNMRNYGWARLHDPRRLKVVLVNGGHTISGYADTQLRQCPSQATSSNCKMSIRVAIPAGQATGSYTVYLQAPSSYSTAQTRPFMVRFANANSGSQQWDDVNGRMASGTRLTVN